MATPQSPRHDPRQDSDKPYNPDTAPTAEQMAHDQDEMKKRRADEARKIFDEAEADAKDDDRPVTTATDQLIRSAEMQEVGPEAWMAEQERRIRERQGDPPVEPRQVRGVAPVQRPH